MQSFVLRGREILEKKGRYEGSWTISSACGHVIRETKSFPGSGKTLRLGASGSQKWEALGAHSFCKG